MSRSKRIARVAVLLIGGITVAAIAAPAQAASTGVASVYETTKVQYKAATGKQNRIVLTRSGNTITIDDVVAVKAGKGCRAVAGDRSKVQCTTSKTPNRIRVYTYDRNDVVTNNADVWLTADAGTGNDQLLGGSRADRLIGGAGVDRIFGRDGNDYLTGDAGNDVLNGGAGDDALDGEDDPVAADLLDGGANGTLGDDCIAYRSDTRVGCER